MARRSRKSAGAPPAAGAIAVDAAGSADRGVPAPPAPADAIDLADDAANDDPGGFEMRGGTIVVQSVAARGRRRAGFAFGSEPRAILVDDLSEAQLAAILADGQLAVAFEAGGNVR